MINLRNSLMVLALAAFCAPVGAQDIYRSVDEDGVVTYSDMPSQDAQEIDVDPNVVEVTPERRDTGAQDGAPGARERSADAPGRVKQEAADGEDVVYIDDGVDRRDVERQRAKEVAGQKKEQQREGGTDGRGREAGEGVSRPGEKGGRINRGGRPGGGRGR